MSRFTQKETTFAFGSTAFIWQIVFFYAPIALLFAGSFFAYDEWGNVSGVTAGNFHPFFSATYFSIILSTTFFATLTALICLCIAYPLAYVIVFYGRRFRYILLFFVIVPFWTNFLLHVYAWFFILEKDGFLNNFLLKIGLISSPIAFFGSYFSVMLMLVYLYLPFMVLPIYAALERFQQEFLEASYDLGASHLQTFKNILFPLTLPSIRAGFFLVLIPAFGEFIVPDLMGGDKFYFVGNVITQLILGDTTAGLGAAFTLISVAALLLALGIYVKFFNMLSARIDRRVL